MALPSLPLPPVPGRLTPGPPSFAIDQDLSSTHQALQDTFLKLQSSLLTSLDNQLIKADAETKHHQYAARKGEEELRHVGEELYRAEREVGRLNGGLGQVRTILQHSEADRRVLETDREAAERELAKTQNANKNLSTNLTQIRRRLDDSVTKIGHMGQVNAAYFSSIKIQRRVEEKLKKELEMSEEKRKAAEEDHEEANKRCELLTKEKKGLEDLLDGQRHETSMASSALAKTHSEMRALAYQKRHLEKQWEDAVAAMAKRDKALQAIEGRRSELKEKVVVLEREVGGARRREDEVEQMAKGKELGLYSLLFLQWVQ
ncbi:hypothetical protein DFS34DRAFT_99720 [Phlyctochytrium arcticum]|nr:hypothetical protein DFS34DRAFT_99720 [Phlyctochytrium arcticum]